jgi:hypothetical protein
LEKVPLSLPNEEDFLKHNKFVIATDSLHIYMLWIRDYKIKSAISPLSFEQEKVRNIIINRRKLELLAAMKKNLFETSLEKGKAEIYQK